MIEICMLNWNVELADKILSGLRVNSKMASDHVGEGRASGKLRWI